MITDKTAKGPEQWNVIVWGTLVRRSLRPVARAWASVRALYARLSLLPVVASIAVLGLMGRAFAQVADGGNNNPDDIVNKAVCGANGWLTWFTSAKFLVVILAAGLIGFFIGRAVGKRDNDGIMGAFLAVLGLGAIRILVKVVTTC